MPSFAGFARAAPFALAWFRDPGYPQVTKQWCNDKESRLADLYLHELLTQLQARGYMTEQQREQQVLTREYKRVFDFVFVITRGEGRIRRGAAPKGLSDFNFRIPLRIFVSG